MPDSPPPVKPRPEMAIEPSKTAASGRFHRCGRRRPEEKKPVRGLRAAPSAPGFRSTDHHWSHGKPLVYQMVNQLDRPLTIGRLTGRLPLVHAGSIRPPPRLRKKTLPCRSSLLSAPRGAQENPRPPSFSQRELARAGRQGSVAIIDADPNKPVSQWAERPGKPENLIVISDISEKTIIDEIENAAEQVTFTIVDLEGTASVMVAYAISRADLVDHSHARLATGFSRGGKAVAPDPAAGEGIREDPVRHSLYAHERGNPAAHASPHPEKLPQTRHFCIRDANSRARGIPRAVFVWRDDLDA